jgi:hypothetical protein
MADKARYRPQAPGDGCGNILLTRGECNDRQRLEREAMEYAKQFLAEEDDRRFRIGCSHYEYNRAFVWTIEAARQLASGTDGRETAIRLLEMAAAEVRSGRPSVD